MRTACPASCLFIGSVLLALPPRAGADPAGPALIPRPRTRAEAPGALLIGETSRIVAADAALEPLAVVLAGEIERVFERRLAVAGGPSQPADIVLEIDRSLSGEAYRLGV